MEQLKQGPLREQLQNQLQNCSEVEIRSRLSCIDGWQKVLSGSPLTPVAYLHSEIEYQNTYFSENFEVQDLSQVFFQDGHPVAVLPLVLRKSKQDEFTLTGPSTPVLSPLFISGLGDKVMKAVCDGSLSICQKISELFQIPEVSFRNRLDLLGSAFFYRKSLEQGASTALAHEMKIDLQLDPAIIKANFRSSYKSLISQGMKTWKSEILEGLKAGSTFPEFQNLHRQVAGRTTRSQKTWDLQKKSIEEGFGFLITLRNQENILVGAALFSHSTTEAQYAVAAYDRELFDKPLGHAVQWLAIEHMKNKGLKNYFLGLRPYSQDIPSPSEKELSIAKFKEGFMTTLELRPVTSLRAAKT